jgi:LacI family transcriptional regulator
MTQAVRAKQIDGLVVLVPPGMLDYVEDLHHQGLPTVLIDDRGYGAAFPAVTTDNVAGGYAATQHLLQRGRRRIAYINGNQEFGCSQDRLAGYLGALHDAGIEPDDALIYEGNFTEERGEIGMELLLARGIAIDAVFCANDQMAFGAMKVLRRAGKRIPEDVAIVGFDDIYAAAYTTPSLTTIRQPFYEMGQMGVSLLLERLNDRQITPSPILLPTTLVVRDSSAAAHSA